jgi:uncharacterized protein YoxC
LNEFKLLFKTINLRDDMEIEEYNETKQETLDQLKELNESISKMKDGNLSLIDEANSMQLTIQAAISNAFQTPEVLQMFAKKQQPELRQRLAAVISSSSSSSFLFCFKLN